MYRKEKVMEQDHITKSFHHMVKAFKGHSCYCSCEECPFNKHIDIDGCSDTICNIMCEISEKID